MKYLAQVFFILITLVLAPASRANPEDCDLGLTTDTAVSSLNLGNFNRNCYDAPFKKNGLYGGTALAQIGNDPFRNSFQTQSLICSCVLEQNDPLGTKKLFNNEDQNIFTSEEYALIHLKRSASKFANQSQLTTNMAILHAQSMGAGTAEKYNLHQDVSINDDYKKFIMDAISSNTQEGLKNSKRTTEELTKEILTVFNQKAALKEVAPITDVLTNSKLNGETCYPMHIYLFTKTLPSKPEFYESIGNSYNKSDWDITELKSKFKFGGMGLSRKGRDQIKGKIEFLEKNPMLKILFNSENTAAQRKAFEVIKKNIGSFKCRDLGDGCDTQFANTNRLKNYRDDLNMLMNDPEMIAIVQEGRKQDLNGQLFDLIQDSKNKNDIGTLDDYAANTYGLSLPDCQNSFSTQATFLRSPSSVSNLGLSADMMTLDYNSGTELMTTKGKKANCDRMMDEYCNAVRFTSNPEVTQAIIGSTSNANAAELDELYSDISKQMNPDPVANGEYQTSTSSFCDEEKRKLGRKSVTFAEFKEDFCKKESNFEVCQDRKRLFFSFLKLVSDGSFAKKYNMGTVASSEHILDIEVASLSDRERKKFESVENTFSSIFGNDKKRKSETPGNVSLTNSFESDLVSSEEIVRGGSAEIRTPSFQSAQSSIQSNDYVYALNSARDTKKEIDEEIKVTKDSLLYNKERLARENTTPEFKAEIEERVKLLESLLQEKEKSSSEYQNIIAKLIDKRDEDQSSIQQQAKLATIKPTSLTDGAVEEIRTQSPSRMIASQKSNESEETSRTPASVSENFSTSGGARGGAGAMGGSSLSGSSAMSARSPGTTKINSALLSKYGITVQDNDANVLVAPDKERGQLSNLLTNAVKSDFGVEVSKVEYDKFKNNDISALNKLYAEKVGALDTEVVKLMIHAKGEDDSLEFYAIKEDGKIVFQPVRKTRLSDLQNALNQ